MTVRSPIRAAALLAALLAAGCGGGGGGAGNGISLSTQAVTITEVQGPNWPMGTNVAVAVTAPDAASAEVGPPPGETWPAWLYVSLTGSGRTGTLAVGLGALRTMPIGTHHATIRLTVRRADGSELGHRDVAVTYLVVAGFGPYPTDLTHSWSISAHWGSPAQESFLQGTAGLAWTATVDQPWVTLDATSGVVPHPLMIGFDPTGLSAGTYHAIVTIHGGSNPDAIAVTLVVSP